MRGIVIWLAPLNLALGLAFESYGAHRHWGWSEPAVDAFTFALYFYYLWRPPLGLSRSTLLVCLGLATFGELVMTGLFQFYLYRVSLVPFFVPPGHVLLFLTGVALARSPRVPEHFALAVPFFVFALFLAELWRGYDWLSLGFFLVFFPSLKWGPDRKLYALMFTLALFLELYGTALGTWRWQPKLLGFGLVLDSANPPLAAGAGYAMLDLVTFWLVSSLRFPRSGPVEVTGELRR